MRICPFAAILCLMAASLPASAEQANVSISKQDCAKLVRHNPSADVAYKPGVDAKGRAVASADLPGSGNSIKMLPDVLEFPVSINPFTYKNMNRVKGTENTWMTMGTVKYDMGKGTWTYNDQPLGSADQQAIAEACGKRGVK
jgi:hypothetical protein